MAPIRSQTLTQTHQIVPLIATHDSRLLSRYYQGMHWFLYEQHDHHGPLFASDVVVTVENMAAAGLLDDPHEEQLRASLGSYLGMIHAGVLSADGTLHPQVSTLVHLDDPDVARGYAAGRDFYFLEADSDEERIITDAFLISQLAEIMHDAALARVVDPEELIRFCLGNLLGELSGRLFFWTPQEQQAWETECIRELGYVCAVPPNCLVALKGVATLSAVS